MTGQGWLRGGNFSNHTTVIIEIHKSGCKNKKARKKAWRSHYCVNKQKLQFRGYSAYVVGLGQKKCASGVIHWCTKKGNERARKKPRRSRFLVARGIQKTGAITCVAAIQ